jgi:hypothetical protein
MNGRINIKIEGQDVPLFFKYPAIVMFAEASHGKDNMYFTPGETSNFTAEGLAKLMQCAYLNACEIKEMEPMYKLEDFYNWVEDKQENEQDAILAVMTCYAESSVMKKAVEIAKAGEKKSPQDLPILTPSNGSSTENFVGDPVILETPVSETLSLP